MRIFEYLFMQRENIRVQTMEGTASEWSLSANVFP